MSSATLFQNVFANYNRILMPPKEGAVLNGDLSDTDFSQISATLNSQQN